MSGQRSYRVPFVIEQNNATGAVSFWQRGDHQSEADARGVSLAEYIHMLYGLIRQSKAKTVLMIGCGGGSLATMLHRAGVAVTAVDIDPASFEIARTYFHMPDGIACHVGDGAAFLKASAQRYDAIVLDAYSKEKVPRHLIANSFFELVRAKLKRGGIFLINLIAEGDGDKGPAYICWRMAGVWPLARLLDGKGEDNRNVIAMAGAVKNLKPPRVTMRPARRAKAIARHLKAMHLRDYRQ